MSLGSIVALATERIVAPVEGMHRAIARPWFAATGPFAGPVRATYGAITGAVYASIRVGAALVGKALDAPSSAGTRAIVNGLWGDSLGRHEPRLGMTMSLRDVDGGPLPAAPEAAVTAGRIVVLLHGLMTTERGWHGTDSRPGLIRRLDDHGGLSPVAVRYNTGLPTAVNGERLASMLEDLVSGWPHRVESIAMVGHSMGGLVIHSACASAHAAGHAWVDRVSDVVTIGSPHHGAPLEKLVAVAARALAVAPQTRPLADFLNTRSGGIRDLRAARNDLGPDAGWSDLNHDVRHHFVAGVFTSDPGHPLGAIVGDLMVLPSSSTQARRLEPTSVAVLGGVHHFDMLHEPAVIKAVMGRLAPVS